VDGATVEMRYTFQDGEENFPGTLPVRVRYSVTDDNELAMEYDAVAVDQATVGNFTGHTFFNLGGHASGDILGHVLQVNGRHFLPVDATLIPTGELRPVDGTPMDFTTPRTFGERIFQEDEQLKLGQGYDHHYVLDKQGAELSLAARISEPKSGRVMEVWSTEPGIQVYSGNYLEGQVPRDVGKGGTVYALRTGFCLEPSHFPDSVNQPGFPTTVIERGERYSGRTIYRFSVK
jgi:aldose 1-epimerase